MVTVLEIVLEIVLEALCGLLGNPIVKLLSLLISDQIHMVI